MIFVINSYLFYIIQTGITPILGAKMFLSHKPFKSLHVDFFFAVCISI